MPFNPIRLGACAAAALAMSAGAAHAQQLDNLLIVDLSVENEVTITADSGLSAATISVIDGDGTGVYLDNFYNAGDLGGGLFNASGTGDLSSADNMSDGSPGLFRFSTGPDAGLNFFTWTSDSSVGFTAGTQAFTGSATWTVSADDYADMLAGNTSGNLFYPADREGDVASATLLGTWSVIPTPGALALFGLAGTTALRRRR